MVVQKFYMCRYSIISERCDCFSRTMVDATGTSQQLTKLQLLSLVIQLSHVAARTLC